MEKKATAKTTMNLVTSCLMILAKVFVYKPVVLQIQENTDKIKEAYFKSLSSFNYNRSTERAKGANTVA